jgi:hypothetical protein
VKKLNDKWFRFVGIPLIALMGHLIFFNRNNQGDERFGFWEIYFIALAETLLLWEVDRVIILRFRNKYPALQQTRKRIVSLFVYCTLLTLFIRIANIWFYDKTLLWGYRFPLEGYLYSVSVALLFVVIVGGIYEGIYYFSKWNKASLEAEQLKRENLQTQLDSLKTQINPHFLFNSLSSLVSLIMEDQKRAVAFTEELSAVYRYLLQANSATLTTLREELQFAAAYYSLLQNRFEDSIRMTIAVEEEALDLLIPPLSLQLLLENAVKHNATLPEDPLSITIENRDQYLVVSNSLHAKNSTVLSNKVGLKNIFAKYELLNQPGIVVEKTATHFIVKLPLINIYQHAYSDSGR